MSKTIVYQKAFDGSAIEDFDPMDILNHDDIVTDIFGDAHGTFTVTVTYEPDPNYDPYLE